MRLGYIRLIRFREMAPYSLNGKLPCEVATSERLNEWSHGRPTANSSAALESSHQDHAVEVPNLHGV